MPHTLVAPVEFVQDIKKSRFIGNAAPIASEEDAKAFLTTVSDPSGNHNCWAWRLGQAYRFSDDGEPSGTAGKPILQAIDGQDLDGVVVVITRFFGGILLGSGGLMRAYGGTAAQMLRAAGKREIIPMVTGDCTVSFSDLALIKARLGAIPHLSITETFTADGVDLAITLRQGNEGEAARLVRDLTSGRSNLTFPD